MQREYLSFFITVGVWGLLVVGCTTQQPPRKRTLEVQTLSCQDANRLSYKAVTTLGFTITAFQAASPGQPGFIVATKKGVKDGKVTITCTDSGAIVEPEKTGVVIPSMVKSEHPNEFPQVFLQSFNVLRMNEEHAARTGPEKGLVFTMTRLNGFESQIELGADLPASGVLPMKVVISNTTSRPYGFDADKVYLLSSGGGRVSPSSAPAAGQGKVLHGEMTIQSGHTVTGYLFYPAGDYTSARTTLIDKETDEGEGFSVEF